MDSRMKWIALTTLLFCLLHTIGNAQTRHLIVQNDDLKQIIDTAQPGDTLFFKSGVWSANPYIIDKPLVLIGSDGTQFRADAKGSIFHVLSDSVQITGIHFEGVAQSSMTDNAAVLVETGNGCSIINNTFSNNYFAIYLRESNNCVINKNTITAAGKSESSSGNGIHLWKSKRVDIKENTISGHRDGIYLEFADSISVISNNSNNNIRYGLHFMFSNSCEYIENTFERNGAGVAVMYSSRVNMFRNNFLHNWGATSYGLLLKDINDSEIRDNTFHRNTTGMHSEGSNRIEISNNVFLSNGKAVNLMASSSENRFINNDFSSNTLDVSTNSKSHFNTFESNYWSGYSGYDLDRNGVGDIHHRPVRLFAYLIERNPVAMILLRSLFIELLDAAERIFPVLSPELLIDATPSMKPHRS
jgi:nitrous oxidase accessory protein